MTIGPGPGFASGTAEVNGTTLHYVRGGDGPTLVLLHGFPQDWYEWHRILPRLARRFTVLAVDQRGVGGSAPSDDGFDAAGLAEDVHQLVHALGPGPAHVVGHDIGGWVAYALARLHPQTTRSVLVMETLLPGIEPPGAPAPEVPLWHIEFHQQPELPETLVRGRQAEYFRHFLGNGVVSDEEVAHYAEAYRDPDHLSAAFATYRAIPRNVAFNTGHTDPIDVPLLLVGGEHVFGPRMPFLADHLRTRHGWSSVRAEIVPGGRHYLPDEHPDEVAELVEHHAGTR